MAKLRSFVTCGHLLVEWDFSRRIIGRAVPEPSCAPQFCLNLQTVVANPRFFWLEWHQQRDDLGHQLAYVHLLP